MGEDESILLAKYGIKNESKVVYLYREHRYDSAKDAINFAKLEAERDQDTVSPLDE